MRIHRMALGLTACLGLTGCGGGGSQSSPVVTPANTAANNVPATAAGAVPSGTTPTPTSTPTTGAGRTPPAPVLPVPPAPLLPLSALNKSGPITIMPLGDSITYGYMDPSGDGYRRQLWYDLTRVGDTISYCGSVSNGSPDLPDTRNEGHGGYTIAQIAAGLDGWLANTQPAVVLLMAGTNDVVGGGDPSSAADRLSALIEQIRRDDPAGEIVVASIPPTSRSDALEAQVQAYNALVLTLVQSKAAQGEPVAYADIHSALTTSDLVDGVHPTPAGYAKIGDAWFQALQQL